MGLNEVYDHCVNLVKEFFNGRHGCVHFLLGLHTMYTVITALVPRGSRVIVLDPQDGGHLPHTWWACCHRTADHGASGRTGGGIRHHLGQHAPTWSVPST
ncbi:hypothetical protein [Streptomyces sp. V1I1]|uniref:hypothetical protein n=1 Tax=Streptomyces sp. V1I1 TaxID=3042272 RepID=UPI0027823BE6|nr:hypothetical protein [Streptomyces sp. V1I1]MDQ0938373.1 glycine/serine hydroxymethyltransferase [Streptomyces sp. V1I1]